MSLGAGVFATMGVLTAAGFFATDRLRSVDKGIEAVWRSLRGNTVVGVISAAVAGDISIYGTREAKQSPSSHWPLPAVPG